MFDDSWGNIGNFLQGLGALGLVAVGAFTAFFGIKGYQEKTQVEKAKWLSELFKTFFVDPTFKSIRQRIDFNDLDAIKILIAEELSWHRKKIPISFGPEEKDLLDSFTDYLNFFEFVGLLRRNGRLTDKDIEWLFDYYIKRLVEVDTDNSIRVYLRALNFQNFTHLLNRVSSYLFVYGTLKRGYSRHRLIYDGGFKFIGTVRVHGILYSLPGETFPAAVFGDVPSFVEGELYRIPLDRCDVLDDIDEEEEVNSGLFARRLIEIKLGGTTYISWTYHYMKSVESENEIPSGVFGD